MEQEEPTYAHPIIGFRCWNITSEGGLGGIANKTAWRADRATVSNCAQYGHKAPTADCSCGLYAYYQPDQPDSKRYPVIGIVVGKGHVELHRTGFRMEEAHIVALAATAKASKQQIAQIQRIADEYQVPVINQQDLAATAQQYGPLFDPKTLDKQFPQPTAYPVIGQQSIVQQRQQKLAVRQGDYRWLFAGYACITLFAVVLACAFVFSTRDEKITPQPLKDPVTHRMLQPPPASLLTSRQTMQHPDRWHLAPAAAWLHSPYRKWLQLYVDENSGEKMPALALSAAQQTTWLVNQVRDIQHWKSSRQREHLTIIYLTAGIVLLIIPMMLLYLVSVALYRWRTNRLQQQLTNT